MRVLFIPLTQPSHYYPMVSLAWAFRTAGHEVRIAGQPPVMSAVVNSGIAAVSVGGSYDLHADLRRSEEVFIQETGRRLGEFKDFSEIPPDALRRHVSIRRAAHVKTADVMARDLIPFIEFWQPDLLVADLITLAGPLAAEVTGTPLALHSWGPQFAAAMFADQSEQAEFWRADLRPLYARFGAELQGDKSICTVHPCPPSLQKVTTQKHLITRVVPYNGANIDPPWLHEPTDRPRVCVSWSLSKTSTVGWDQDRLSNLIKLLAANDMEVVVTISAASGVQLGSLPDGVRVVEELPLSILLPSCAAAVHHGGAGTTLTAASYGVPQVMQPQGLDHVINAELIASAGAGVCFREGQAGVEEVAAAVSAVNSESSYRKAARALQEENAAQPSPAATVKVIEELVAVTKAGVS